MARFYNGSSDFLGVSSAIVTSEPFTLACWFQSSSTTAAQALMSVADSGSSNDNYHDLVLRGDVGGDPINARTRSGGVTSGASTSSGYSGSTWHHAAGVWASTSSRAAYIDGSNKGTNSDSKSVSGLDRFRIAQHARDTGGLFLAGFTAEHAVWGVALTDAEIAILAKGYSPLMVRPESLLAYWPAIGRYSSEIDLVGSNGLTVTGATATAHPRVIYPSRRNRIFVPTAVGDSVSATAALSVGGASVAASATHTAPTYTASATPGIGGATIAASATFTAPVYTAAVSVTSGAGVITSDGTVTPPTYTATVAAGVSGPTIASSATHTAPTYTATVSAGIGGPTIAAAAIFTDASTVTATVSLTIGGATIVTVATAALDSAAFETVVGQRYFETVVSARDFETVAGTRYFEAVVSAR